jgi:hypothetical protein
MRHSERPVTTLERHETSVLLANDINGGERNEDINV